MVNGDGRSGGRLGVESTSRRNDTGAMGDGDHHHHLHQHPPHFSPIRVTAKHSPHSLPDYARRLMQLSGSGMMQTSDAAADTDENGNGGRVPVSSNTDKFPSQWNAKDKCILMELSRHGLRVSYNGNGKSDSDAATVRANYPMRPDLGLFYYEVEVISKGRDGYIGIGFCAGSVSLQRLPGWENLSWGYHGDDGNSFGCSGTGKPFGPTYTTRDIIGCGVNFMTRQAFYTKNGVMVGTAFPKLDLESSGPLFPAVGLRTPGEVVEANFGQTPFIFDIGQYVEDEREKLRLQIQPLPIAALAKDESMVLHDTVVDYLIHSGYSETARALVQDFGIQQQQQSLVGAKIDQRSLTDSANRKSIQERVMQGDVDGAIQLTQELYPGVLMEDSNGQNATTTPILFQLKCRLFIEMIATDDRMDMGDDSNNTQNDIADDSFQQILSFGQELQDTYRDDDRAAVQQALMDIFSLLAYKDPAKSPVGDLLHPRHRAPLARALNEAILVHGGAEPKSQLERAARQLGAVTVQLAEEERGCAPFIRSLAGVSFSCGPT